jgi:hypothetical protein
MGRPKMLVETAARAKRARPLGGAVERAERLLHQLRDVHELGAALGLEADLLHGLRILRDDASRPAL